MKIDVNIKPNSCDKVRLERFDEETIKNSDIYEYLLMGHIERLLLAKKLMETKKIDYQKKLKHKRINR